MQSTVPDLQQVYQRVAKLKGVVIKAEMVRPSTVPMEFKIAPGGFFFAKYPTSETYLANKEQVTWMPEKREFVKGKPEDGNPLPAGFEVLWPGGELLLADGGSRQTTFAGQPAVELPCKATAGHSVLLYVQPTTLLPLGTVATAQGTQYEMRYLSVTEAALTPAHFTFIAPRDAKAPGGGPDLSKLIRAGAALPAFKGTDCNGKVVHYPGRVKWARGFVLNFWFSACTGCVQEMPYLAKLAPALKAQGIGLIGINPIDTQRSAKRTSATNKLTYPTLIGAPAQDLARSVGVVAYPVSIVVNAQGSVVDAIVGFDEKRLVTALKRVGYKPK